MAQTTDPIVLNLPRTQVMTVRPICFDGTPLEGKEFAEITSVLYYGYEASAPWSERAVARFTAQDDALWTFSPAKKAVTPVNIEASPDSAVAASGSAAALPAPDVAATPPVLVQHGFTRRLVLYQNGRGLRQTRPVVFITPSQSSDVDLMDLPAGALQQYKARVSLYATEFMLGCCSDAGDMVAVGLSRSAAIAKAMQLDTLVMRVRNFIDADDHAACVCHCSIV